MQLKGVGSISRSAEKPFRRCAIVLDRHVAHGGFCAFRRRPRPWVDDFNRACFVVRSQRSRLWKARRLLLSVFSFACDFFSLLQHFAAMSGLISLGSEKMTSARSPIIPASTRAGALFSGPSLLASVFRRRFRSQNLRDCPLAVVTV